MNAALAWLLGLPSKVKEYAVIGGATILAAAYAFVRVKQMGVDEEKAREAKADDALDKKLDKIDSSPLATDAAVQRLRERAARQWADKG